MPCGRAGRRASLGEGANTVEHEPPRGAGHDMSVVIAKCAAGLRHHQHRGRQDEERVMRQQMRGIDEHDLLSRPASVPTFAPLTIVVLPGGLSPLRRILEYVREFQLVALRAYCIVRQGSPVGRGAATGGAGPVMSR